MKRKRLLSITVCAFLVTLGISAIRINTIATAATTTYTITAKTATSTGAIKYGGIGWLYGILSNGTPADSAITGLVHPQYTGQMAPGGTQHNVGDAFVVTPEAKRTGIKGIDIYVQDYYSAWPYPVNGIDSYISNVVNVVARKVVASPDRSYYRYVLFNEPDWIWYGTSGTKLTNFKNDWLKAYKALRAIDSTAKIIGPSFSAYNAAAYDSFFSFAKSNNCLPDITSWHDLNGPSLDSEYSSYRSIEAKYGISAREVYINEYGRSTGEMARPGRMIQYLARMENHKVLGGMAWWGGTLDFLVGTDNKPTGGWQLYRWYGETKGNTVSLTDSDGTGCNQGMAFHNSGNNIKVIFGGSLNDSDVYTEKVVITGLTGSSQSYTVYGTDYTTLGASAYTVSSGTATVSGGQATITVTGCKGLSAYMVQMGS